MFTVWLHIFGSDTNDGSQPSPVKSLTRAQDIVRAAAPDDDVEIRIHLGTYTAGQTTWDYYIPGHTITFMPDDYEIGEGFSGIAGRPVFRSNGETGYWFVATLSDGQSADLAAGLRFYYLHVERYGRGGLMFYGRTEVVDGYRVPTVGLNGNTVWGMKFEKIGSLWGAETGYGGLSLNNSSGNYINANQFRYLDNVDPYESYIHGVYALHGSSSNVIRKSSFYRNSGDPVRMRNRSGGNDIHECTFNLTGEAAYSEWFCDGDCVAGNPGSSLECPSEGNVFHDNDVVTGYTGAALKVWELHGDETPGCSLAGPRLTTYGNT